MEIDKGHPKGRTGPALRNNLTDIRNNAQQERNRSLWSQLGPSAALLKTEDIEFREYQFNIVKTIHSGENTLVILPTGKGKTKLKFFAAALPLSMGKKAIIVAAQRPLVAQHYNNARNTFRDPEGIAIVTGETNSGDRAEIEKNAKLMIGTPETFLFDIKSGRMSLEGHSMLIIDETQRVRGDYAYTHLADICNEKGMQIVTFTGSLSSRTEIAQSIVDRLRITRIEARSKKDRDIASYIMPTQVKKRPVEKSETFKEIEKHFKIIMEGNFKILKDATLTGELLKDVKLSKYNHVEEMPYAKFNALGDSIKQLSNDVWTYKISKESLREKAIAAIKSYWKLSYMLHPHVLFETQGYGPVMEHVKQLKKEKKSKSFKELYESYNFQQIGSLMSAAIKSGEEHPKVNELISVLEENKTKKIIVFAQYRSTVRMLVEKLTEKGIAAQPFMGKKDGMTEKQQTQAIEDFKDSKFRVLVSTSIGEEGIDIPKVPLVVFYEPVPSAIRSIQRKGRTGRNQPGEVIILVTNGTRDEVYYRIAGFRESNMNRIVDVLRKDNPNQENAPEAPIQQIPVPKEPAKKKGIKITNQLNLFS